MRLKKMQKVRKRDKEEGEGGAGPASRPRGGRGARRADGAGARGPGPRGPAPRRVRLDPCPGRSPQPAPTPTPPSPAQSGRGKGHPLEGAPGSAWDGGWSSCPLGGTGPVLKNSRRRHCDLRGRLFPQRSGKQGILRPWAPPGLFSPAASVLEASWGLTGGQHTSEGRTHPSLTLDGDRVCHPTASGPPHPPSPARCSQTQHL